MMMTTYIANVKYGNDELLRQVNDNFTYKFLMSGYSELCHSVAQDKVAIMWLLPLLMREQREFDRA
jgi:hypothetical protein